VRASRVHFARVLLVLDHRVKVLQPSPLMYVSNVRLSLSFFFFKDNTPRKLTRTRRGAMACNTEGTTVSEVAAVVNSLGRAGVSREMRDSSTVGMGWA
jgi:hypothetical protein